MDCRWMVSELVDPRDSLPRYVIAHRQGEAPWRCVQEVADKLPGRLAAWLTALTADGVEPLARPLLGHGFALNERTAHAVCRFRVREINRMATGNPHEWASFLFNQEPINCGGRGRPCAVLTDNTVVLYASISEAARHVGIARETVGRAIRQGRRCGGGRVAV